MTIQNRNDINSSSKIGDFFKGTGILDFKINQDPFIKQRSMTNTTISDIKNIYYKGPSKLSKVIRTITDNWSLKGIDLNRVKNNLIDKSIYGLAIQMAGEGVTIWGLNVDDKWNGEEGLKNLDSIIKDDLINRRWVTAYDKALQELSNKKEVPYTPAFVCSVTIQEKGIPYFGRVVWGVAEANGIISLTQIPIMMGKSSQYFTWSFVSGKGIDEKELFSKFGGKNGGEMEYERFSKGREWLLENCEPLNPKGEYSFAKGNEKPLDQDDKEAKPKAPEAPNYNGNEKDKEEDKSENPLVQASQESLNRSIDRSRLMAESAYKKQYRLINEYWKGDDDDEEDMSPIEGDSASYRSGQPFVNKLKTNGDGVPIVGPLY